MSNGTEAFDPSVSDYRDTSPASLGRGMRSHLPSFAGEMPSTPARTTMLGRSGRTRPDLHRRRKNQRHELVYEG